MAVGKPLLVALMFVTILTLGIASILSSLASAVTHGSDVRKKALHFGWIGILLLAYFDLFWQSDVILTRETWYFPSFLFTVTGPILLFFATQVLIASAAIEDVERDTAFEPLVERRFLFLLLVFRLGSHVAFERRCIPARCVTPRSHTPVFLPRRALRSGRLDALGANITSETKH